VPPALGRGLVVQNFFHLRVMEATVFLGTFNAAEMTNHLNLPQVDSNQVKEISKDDQWKQDGPELNFQPHSKGSENVCK
jgi:hypothetical protein